MVLDAFSIFRLSIIARDCKQACLTASDTYPMTSSIEPHRRKTKINLNANLNHNLNVAKNIVAPLVRIFFSEFHFVQNRMHLGIAKSFLS